MIGTIAAWTSGRRPSAGRSREAKSVGHAPLVRRAVACALLGASLLACGAESGGGSSTTGAGGPGTGSGAGSTGTGGGGSALHALHVKIALTDDGKGVGLLAQNGSTVYVPAADIAGKTTYWATSEGGEPVSGVGPIEFGSTVMGNDLTAEFSASAKYGDGPWEMSCFVSVTGGMLMNGPEPGDLGAFDNDPPPAGEPPVTGSSVRMHVKGADAEVTLGNDAFIQF